MSKQMTDFQKEMEEHLINFKEQNQYISYNNPKRRWRYNDLSDNIFPPVRHGVQQVLYDNYIPLHDYINHVRSSQAFGINAFYPILKNEEDKLLNLLSEKINVKLESIKMYQFEYSLQKNYLGEWKGITRPDDYVTAADLLILCIDDNNKKHTFIIEVKFTESSFSKCGGYTSKGNTGQTSKGCGDIYKIFTDVNQCYLHSKTTKKPSRRYFEYLGDLKGAFPNLKAGDRCPFNDNNQCLRNHALARALVVEGETDYAHFTLFCHNQNDEIKEAWEKYVNILSDKLKKDLILIEASELISRSGDVTYKKYFKDRYKVV